MKTNRKDDGTPKETEESSVSTRKVQPGKTGAERGDKNTEALMKIAEEKQAAMGEKLDDDTKKAFKTDVKNTAGLGLLKKHLLSILAMTFVCVAGAVPEDKKNCGARPKKTAPGHVKANDISYMKKVGLARCYYPGTFQDSKPQGASTIP